MIKQFSTHPVARIVKLTGGWGEIAVLAMLAVLAGLLELAGIGSIFFLIRIFADAQQGAVQSWFARWWMDILGVGDPIVLVRWLCLVLLGILGLKAVAGLLIGRHKSRVLARRHQRLASLMFTTHLRDEYEHAASRDSTIFQRNLAIEADNCVQTHLSMLVELGAELVIVLIFGSILLFSQPLPSLVLLTYLVSAFLLVARLTRKRAVELGDIRLAAMGSLQSLLRDVAHSLRAIRVGGLVDYTTAQFSSAIRTYSNARSAGQFFGVVPRIMLETIVLSSLVILVLFLVLTGRTAGAVIETLTVFGLFALRLTPSATRIAHALNYLRITTSSVKEVLGDLDAATLDPIYETYDRRQLEFTDSIAFHDVTFRHRTSIGHPALQSVNLTLAAGTLTAVIGKSGSGKSTLLDLLMALTTPTAGHVRVDGWDVQSVAHQWHSMIGYVPQRTHVIDDTIRANVAYGVSRNEVSEAQIWEALRQADLAGFVEGLPDGLDYRVGEDGMRLSGGQRQRLGIARALYTDPPVLILDEPTSAMDAETEQRVISNLHERARLRTIIVVTHRLQALHIYDKIVVMEHGRIVADGPIDELTRTSTAFRQLASAGAAAPL